MQALPRLWWRLRIWMGKPRNPPAWNKRMALIGYRRLLRAAWDAADKRGDYRFKSSIDAITKANDNRLAETYQTPRTQT